jgi:hypothetical protein
MLFGLGQVLHVDNTPPKVSAKFYKADVQLVLLYGSKMWNLSTTALWRGWRGFIFVRPNVWLRNISHIRDQITCGSTLDPSTCSRSAGCTPSCTIDVRREKFSWYLVLDRPNYDSCRIGWTQRRGLTPRQWRWEHKSAWMAKMQMELENIGTLVGLNGWLLDGPI